MQCPKCKSRNLKVQAVFSGWVWLSPTGIEDDPVEVIDTITEEDGEWEDSSCVVCCDCSTHSTAKECEETSQP